MVGQQLPSTFGHLQMEDLKKYQAFFHEELLVEASDALDPSISTKERFTHVTDALVDGLVFMLHLSEILGIRDIFIDAWEEVHQSNLTKGNGQQLFHEGGGKMIKGEKYTPPDIGQFFSDTVTMSFVGRNECLLRDWYLKEVVPSLGGVSVASATNPCHLHISIKDQPWVYAAFRNEVGDHSIKGTTTVMAGIVTKRNTLYADRAPRYVRPYRRDGDRLLPEGMPWGEYAQAHAHQDAGGILSAYHITHHEPKND